MLRRAIILVPGFSKRAQLSARDQLVDSLQHYCDGWEVSAEDASDGDGQNVAFVTAKSRGGEGEIQLGVYEAYWGDLIPDRSEESPWARFRRGTVLISYWGMGGLSKAIWRRELPQRTMVAMACAAFLLLLWYLVVLLLLVQAIANGLGGLPAWLTSFTDLLGLTQAVKDWAAVIAGSSVAGFLIGLWGLGRLEQVANISAFTKDYLQDRPTGDDTVGLRAKTCQRFLSLLDHVHSREGDAEYDEVYVVAHSLGGAVAVDGLAEYGEPLAKTTLITWGSALGALVQQEPLIEDEIRKFYTAPTRIRNWIDVVFQKDFMGSVVPLPRKEGSKALTPARMSQVFPDTITPALPQGYGYLSSQTHDGYFTCETAVLMLVRPADTLPACVDG